MTLYLVKLDPENKDHRGEPRYVATVGRIIETPNGYRFLPATSAHKGSRKTWPTANGCIPLWTEKMGFLRLYDKAELDAARVV